MLVASRSAGGAMEPMVYVSIEYVQSIVCTIVSYIERKKKSEGISESGYGSIYSAVSVADILSR